MNSSWLPDWVPPVLSLPLIIGLGVASLLALVLRKRSFPSWRAWPIVLVMIVALVIELFMLDRTRTREVGELALERNFFGVVRVQRVATNQVPLVQLVHGRINHGFQYEADDLRRQPAGYCGPNSGAGMAILHHPSRDDPDRPMRIGVAGLGVGAMAAYLRKGDLMRFYEINPVVVDWAAGPQAYFSYTRDSRGTVETVLGDARLSLEQEWAETGSQGYDLILLDAFSSDAVPVHLLTVEAFELYQSHLRDGESAILANISNRFLDFEPLMNGVARRYGWKATLFIDIGNPPVPTGSLWVLLSQAGSELAELVPPIQPQPQAGEVPTLLWTDAHSDIFRLLRWKIVPRKVGVFEPPKGLPFP
jgi:spermidine synthase